MTRARARSFSGVIGGHFCDDAQLYPRGSSKEVCVSRKKKESAAEFIQANALLVPLILGDMIEHLGLAAQE
jgi:hypothetical protein